MRKGERKGEQGGGIEIDDTFASYALCTNHSTVADPGFPGGGANLREAIPYYLA